MPTPISGGVGTPYQHLFWRFNTPVWPSKVDDWIYSMYIQHFAKKVFTQSPNSCKRRQFSTFQFVSLFFLLRTSTRENPVDPRSVPTLCQHCANTVPTLCQHLFGPGVGTCQHLFGARCWHTLRAKSVPTLERQPRGQLPQGEGGGQRLVEVSCMPALLDDYQVSCLTVASSLQSSTV